MFLKLRQFMGWILLAGFSTIMFGTLLYWWLQQAKMLVLVGVVVAAGEPNIPVLVAELVVLPSITIWALVEAYWRVQG